MYSWWQLIIVDENKNQPRELKRCKSINFRGYIKIPGFFFISAVISYQQLMAADNCWWKWKSRFGTNINLLCKWKFQLSFFHISCHQLSTAKNSRQNENHPKELKFGAHISLRVCIKHPAHNFLYQLSSAINSCQQLKTRDGNENQPKELKFSAHIALRVCIKHLAHHFLYQLSSAIDSCQQLKIAST